MVGYADGLVDRYFNGLLAPPVYASVGR